MAFLLALVGSASTAWLYSWFHFFTQLWASFCLIPPLCVWCLQTSSLHFQTLSNWEEQPNSLHPWTPASFLPHFPYPWMQSTIKSILFTSWHPVSIVSDSSSQYLPGLYSLPFSAAFCMSGEGSAPWCQLCWDTQGTLPVRGWHCCSHSSFAGVLQWLCAGHWGHWELCHQRGLSVIHRDLLELPIFGNGISR